MSNSTFATLNTSHFPCEFNVSAVAFCESHYSIYDICNDYCISEWRVHHLPTAYPDVVTYGVVFPILLLFVIVANVFVVLVLSRKHMVSPTNQVILYMAIAELFVGLVPFPFTFFYYTMGNWRHVHTDVKVWWCYMYDLMYEGLPPTFHNIANWLTVILALQRFIYIQYPLRAGTLCTLTNVRRASMFVVIVSCVFGIQPLFDLEYSTFNGYTAKFKRTYHSNATSTRITGHFVSYRYSTCLMRSTAFLDFFGDQLFYNIYYWSRVIIFIGLPCILLIALNFLLVLGIRKANMRRARLLMENRQREARRQTESNTTSVMLVIIVSIFLIVNLPQGLFLATFVIKETFGLQIAWLETHRPENYFIRYFLLADNMLIILSYPINFAIYCSMSSQFRDTFKRFFCTELPPLQVMRRRMSRNSTNLLAPPSHMTRDNYCTSRSVAIKKNSNLGVLRFLRHQKKNGTLHRGSTSATNCEELAHISQTHRLSHSQYRSTDINGNDKSVLLDVGSHSAKFSAESVVEESSCEELMIVKHDTCDYIDQPTDVLL